MALTEPTPDTLVPASSAFASPEAPTLPCGECAGSGRCSGCGEERAVAVRRRCVACAGLAVCAACHGTGGALLAIARTSAPLGS